MARRNATILVVDGDSRIHKACSQAFSDFDVRIASNADEASTAFEASKPGALVVETTLDGGVDGLTLVDQLRTSDPDLAVVVLTATPSAQSAVRALRLGVDDYLIKRTDSMSQLKQSVRDGIRTHTRRAEVSRVLHELTELNDAFLENMQTLQRANLDLESKFDAAGDQDPDAWRVLVVDDDVSIVALLETLLRSQGFEVDGANSGAEARSLFAEQRFDVVVTDKNLGDADGVELIGEIHVASPDSVPRCCRFDYS